MREQRPGRRCELVLASRRSGTRSGTLRRIYRAQTGHLADRLLLRLSRANGPARPAICSYPGATTAAQWAKSAVGKEGLGECATILVTSLVCWFSARSAHER